MIISKYGIAFNDGKGFMNWTQYLEILKLFANGSVIEGIMKKMNSMTEYSAMEFEHLQDTEVIEKIAKAVGVRPTKTLEGTKARIKKQLMSKNTSNDIDTFQRI
jgi:hypothetical protein